MSIAVPTKAREFRTDADLALDPRWQTVWMIRPKTALMESQSAAKYAQTRDVRAGGSKVDPVKLYQAEVFSFVSIVESVQNFFAPCSGLDPENPDTAKDAALFGITKDSPRLLPPGAEEEHYSIDASAQNQLTYIFSRSDSTTRKELDQASEDMSRLTDCEKKSSR